MRQTNITWYHFLIKCNNVLYQKGTMQGKPLILFESIRGYASKEEAMQAFLDTYLIILRKAFTDVNYGVNQFISLVEILIHEIDECNKNISSVFVPAETLYEYDGDTIVMVKAIILLAKSYPILYISTGRYRFLLYNKKTETYDWRSVKWYSTPQEAMQHFQFFLTLLDYSGNMYIEKSETDCRYRIFVREVLALSTQAFPTSAEAWGINGVEKFICIAQSENGFHNYLNKKNCSNSFYVACNNIGLIHPCKYETPERRDTVLNKLYQASSFNFFDLLQIDPQNNITLLGLDKKPVANLIIQSNDNAQIDKCEKLIEIFEAINIDTNYAGSDNDVHLTDKNKITIAKPATVGITLADWKKELRSIACYFPVIREQTNSTTAIRKRLECNFYIQINLPGFNTCKDDLANDCPDINSDDNCKPGCYVAWKSDCCFRDCCEALQFYMNSLKLISNFGNYKPVYECSCGYYGIELYEEAFNKDDKRRKSIDTSSIIRWLCDSNANAAGISVDRQNIIFNKCLNEIVAINPQHYPSNEIACAAVKRAHKLINSEGFHLVEHILLRPRCEEDCNCDYLPDTCFNEINSNNERNICHFQWKPGGDIDPCAPDDPACFTPGCDPYSFIATIALPAWPLRFRSAENKAVIEKLLQKEAPAHVLLRILWLNPRDFCCFEFYFKNWNYWLAKKMCDPQYNNCDFLGLLFHKSFQPLNECDECVPCACNKVQAVSCFDDEQEPCGDVSLVTQINNLYCWNRNNYDVYGCENVEIQDAVPVPVLKAVVTTKPGAGTDNNKAKVTAKEIVDVQPATATDNVQKIDAHKKYLILQARSSKYKENIKTIADAKPENKTAENALRFLADTNPNPERYQDLINKILKDKPNKSKKIKGLTLKEKNILIDNISWDYFDRICLNEKNIEKITSEGALFNHLRKNKIDMQLLYDNWNSKELKTLVTGINFNDIKKVVV